MNLGIRSALAAGAVGLAFVIAGCGDDDSDSEADSGSEESSTDLAAVETYLTDHSAELLEQVTILQEKGQEYYDLAESHDFDYEAMMKESGDEVQALMADSQEAFEAANPAYEEMEGSSPACRASRSTTSTSTPAATPATLRARFRSRSSYRTARRSSSRATSSSSPRPRSTGPTPTSSPTSRRTWTATARRRICEGIPDANIYLGAVNEFLAQAESLDADAQAFEATESDAFTAITVMTPTMSEYFEAWKNSAFIAGEDATELGFVATSRLSDIADILEGLVFVYDEVEPMIAEESPEQAEQTGQELADLLAYVEDMRDREEQGEKFDAEDADTLGSQAQRQAEAIAGQVTQAAEQLGIEIQDA